MQAALPIGTQHARVTHTPVPWTSAALRLVCSSSRLFQSVDADAPSILALLGTPALHRLGQEALPRAVPWSCRAPETPPAAHYMPPHPGRRFQALPSGVMQGRQWRLAAKACRCSPKCGLRYNYTLLAPTPSPPL